MLPLVLLPGLDGTGRFFWRLERTLSGHVATQVISYPATPIASYDEVVDDVCARFPTGPVVLLGESFSGPVAVRVAAALPDRVKGLILAATFVRNPRPKWLIRALSRYDPKKSPRKLTCWALRGGVCDQELDALLDEVVAKLPPGVRQSRLRVIASADVLQALLALRCPILALHGNDDWLVPKSSIARTLKSNSNTKLKLLAGPHMLLQRNHDHAASEILDFMSSIES